MDGENNGKPYEQMDDLGVPLFLETPIFLCHSGKRRYRESTLLNKYNTFVLYDEYYVYGNHFRSYPISGNLVVVLCRLKSSLSV